MKVRYFALIIFILLAGILPAHGDTGTAIQPNQNPSGTLPLITTAHPVMRRFVIRIPWIGIVAPKASVEVIALAAGRITEFAARDQAHVEKGELVAKLGGARVEQQHARLSAEVGALQSRLSLARSTVKELKRKLELYLATQAEVAAAQDTQVQMEVQLQDARLNLEAFEKQVRILAPISGIFTNRRVSPGQVMDGGQVIGQIIDTRHLRITASFFPSQGIDVQGREASVRIDENKSLAGFVKAVLPQASPTGAMQAWIEGPQIDIDLRPGQTVAGSIQVKTARKSLAVPQSAIVYNEKEIPYFFVRKNDAFEARRVRLGLIQDGWAQVLSGLQPDQTVVTQGAYELFYRHFTRQYKVQD